MSSENIPAARVLTVIRAFIHCSLGLLIFGHGAISFAAPAEKMTLRLPLIAKFSDGRWAKVEIQRLDTVRLLPGDRVKAWREGAATMPAEQWHQTFKWEKRQKKGKNTIVTKMTLDAVDTWEASWGNEIAGFVNVGATTIPLNASVLPTDFNAYEPITPQANCAVKAPPRVVQRPPMVPGHASASPLRSELIIADGAQVGFVVFEIIRPSR